jgi:type IV pilus assembly protein PilA
MKSQRGFTLLEMMVVTGIIGTLASLAIPAYGDYMARGQVSEAVQLVSAARKEVSEHYANYGAWPDALGGAVSARYTSSVSMGGGAGSSEPELVLTATMKAVGVQRDIAGKTLEMVTADGGATWTCQAGTLAEQHVPGACKGS